MEKAFWISSSQPSSENRVYLFRKSFTVTDPHVTAAVCADSRYQLFINGKFVSEGPSKGNDQVTYYDEIDISRYLHEGENQVEAKVLFLADERHWSGIVRKNRAAFLFWARDDQSCLVCTDDSWECCLDEGYRFHASHYVHGNGPMDEEHFYGDLPRNWEKAVVLYPCFNQMMSDWGVLPKYPLQKSIIPRIKAEKSRAFLDAQFPVHIKTEDQPRFIDLEAEAYITGYPVITFSGKGTVRVIYAEAYATSMKGAMPIKNYDRKDKTGSIMGAGDLVHIDAEKAAYSPYWCRAFRFIRLQVEPGSDITVLSAKYKPYRYPLAIENNFSCSDPQFNEMWKVGINTILNCLHETYEDCPYYEQQQYVEDSYLEILFTIMLTRDYAPVRKCILDIWHSQSPDGMVLASAPAMAKQQTTCNAIFWIMMIQKYALYSGDRALVKHLLPSVNKALDLFDQYLTKDGVVGPMPYGLFIDWVDSWQHGFYPQGSRDNPSSIINCMYAYGLLIGEELCRMCGRNGLAGEYRERYEALLPNIRNFFYDPEKKLFRNTVEDRFSEHAQIWAVLAGAAEHPKELLENMNLEEKCSFCYQFFLLRAYEKAGIHYNLSNVLAPWSEMLKQNATTWFETPGEARSDCHGWSCVPLYEFTTKLLGISLTAPNAVTIRPEQNGLSWAKGTLPLPAGNISVSWEQSDNGLHLMVKAPQSITKTILLPSGKTITSDLEEICLTD